MRVSVRLGADSSWGGGVCKGVLLYGMQDQGEGAGLHAAVDEVVLLDDERVGEEGQDVNEGEAVGGEVVEGRDGRVRVGGSVG